MAVIETWLRQDLKAMVNVRSLQGQVFSLDNGGNLIGVKVTRDGEPVALEGTIAGYCILPDGETINITPASGNTGIQNGNEAYVILPQLAYSVPGQISIVIKLAQGSSVTTLAACTGYVYKSRTSDEVVPPGTPIPDLQTLEEAISNANAATSRANTAAAGAENVNAELSQSGGTITITVTDRDGNEQTGTLVDQSEAIAQLNDNVITESVGPAPIVSIKDGADGMPLRNLSVAVEPVQDLHGYDHPWPGGGGKNLCPTFTNATNSGLTLTVTNDGVVTVTGTNTGTAFFAVQLTLPAGNYILNGAPSGGQLTLRNAQGGSAPSSEFSGTFDDYGSGAAFAVSATASVWLNIRLVAGTHNETYKPMIRLASESDPTFEPYSNICPITGWTGAKVTRTGKNLLDWDKFYAGSVKQRCTAAKSGDSVVVTSTAVGSMWIGLATAVGGAVSATAYKMQCVKGQTYVSATEIMYYEIDANSTVLSVTAKTNNAPYIISNQNCVYLGLRLNFGEASAVGATTEITPQIELGSAATAYEPYQGETYDITFPTEAGTVYGGTLTINPDMTGTLVVNKAMKSGEWSRVRLDGSGKCWLIGTVNGAFQYEASQKADAITNVFEVDSLENIRFSNSGLALFMGSAFVAGYSNDTETIDRILQTLSVVYTLATPITYLLTESEITAILSTLYGINNIWADTGDTTVKYPADTKLYIDNKLAELQALVLENNG